MACPEGNRFVLVGYSPDGSLDTAFGTGGMVTTDIPDSTVEQAYDAVLQVDEKIVVAGIGTVSGYRVVAVARYNPEGSLDTSFGSGGFVLTDITIGSDGATSTALQSDGKIVVGGYGKATSGGEFLAARYNIDGSLDTSFGSGGSVLTNVSGGIDYANDVAIQSDGRIVLGGQAEIGTKNQFAMVRYNADGSLDPSFGSAGVVLTDVSPGNDAIYSLSIQSDGKIVAAGRGAVSNKLRVALARYQPDGSLDNSFGSGGKVTVDITSTNGEVAYDVATLPDGMILAAGWGLVNNKNQFLLARYNPAGGLDTGFGNNGAVITDITSSHDEAFALTVQVDGRVILAGEGETSDTNTDLFALARYTPTGSLDGGFGTNGSLSTDIGFGNDEARAVVTQVSGRIIAVGTGYV